MSESIHTTLVAHKGEVMVVFSVPVTNLSFPPQAARDLAQQLIHCAEAAEQQMDAEHKP